MQNAQQYFDQLNHDYMAVHRKKEDLFWSTYMATSTEQQACDQAEKEWNQFISNAARVPEIKQHLSEDLTPELRSGLEGWLALFEANSLQSDTAQQQKNHLIDLEGQIFSKKQANKLYFTNDQGERVEAGLPTLAAAIAANQNESSRKSAHDTLLELEQWILGNGFIDLIKARNAFARAQGFDNFFDYSIQKTEKMSTEQLFSILEDFENQTREANLRSLNKLASQKGEHALLAHNFRFFQSGDVIRELDAYVPFSQSLRRWQESFARLNIDYSGAELTLDLLEREGKYQNGFCHGPIPSYYDGDQWVAAKVNFTSNAKPDQVGSGFGGLATLFHEGGHAAHFANVKQNAPCFSQEFAPTSMAYAETQSMFLDSLLEDADWLKRYAKNAQGETVPDALIQQMVESNQPFKAYEERSILLVPYFERALYSMNEDELTAEAITALARRFEKQILGLEVSPRPLLTIPHLLSDEAACSYQGYLLANMAVYQTRAFFLRTQGYLCDNPAIGPMLAQHYWKPGNSQTHNDTIMSLTGEGFNAKYLADACNLSVEQAWQLQQQKLESMKQRPQSEVADLNARILVVDGDELLASNEESTEAMLQQFEQVIQQRYGV